MKQLPPAFVQRITAQFPSQAEAFLEAIQREPRTAIRYHPHKGKQRHYEGSSIVWSEAGVILNERPVFTLDPHFHAGAYYVQEASSQFLGHVLQQLTDLPEHPLVLDACAAPGGKTTQILSWLDGRGGLVSNELIKARATILQENVRKWGYANVCITQTAPENLGALTHVFDVLVIDAPCSGEGLFRKDAGSIAEWSEQAAAHCAVRQTEIIDQCTEALKPGGYLIYATCTYNPAENQLQMEQLRSAGWQAVEIPIPETWPITSYAHEHQAIGYAFLPHRVDGEGFYLAVLQKPDEPAERWPKTKQKVLFEKNSAFRKKWIQVPEEDAILAFYDDRYWIPAPLVPVMPLLQQFTGLVQAGLHLGTQKGKDLIPSGDLAFYWDWDASAWAQDVSKEEAIQFLRKEAQSVTPFREGWNLVRYETNNLGWIKKIGPRLNNYYPLAWRIRMQNG